MVYQKRAIRRKRARRARLDRPAVKRESTDTRIRVTDQESLDAMADRNVTVIIAGGDPIEPLILRRRFIHPPVVADNCCLAVLPLDRNHPPEVLIEGSGANVLLRGTARAEMRGNSVLRATDQSKARVYAGRLICGDDSKCTLYGKAIGIAWGRAKCSTRNESRIMLLEMARTYVRHASAAYIWGEKARAWKKSDSATVHQAPQGECRTPSLDQVLGKF